MVTRIQQPERRITAVGPEVGNATPRRCPSISIPAPFPPGTHRGRSKVVLVKGYTISSLNLDRLRGYLFAVFNDLCGQVGTGVAIA